MRAMTAHARKREVQSYYASNLAFHWAIVKAAGNETLAHSYRGIVQKLHLSRLKNLSRDIGMQVSLVEHRQIVAAIAEGDAAGAEAALASHVTAAHGRLAAHLHPESRRGRHAMKRRSLLLSAPALLLAAPPGRSRRPFPTSPSATSCRLPPAAAAT